MFILVAPMLETDTVELASGNGKEQVIDNREEDFVIDVHVKNDNTIWVNKKEVNDYQLKVFF